MRLTHHNLGDGIYVVRSNGKRLGVVTKNPVTRKWWVKPDDTLTWTEPYETRREASEALRSWKAAQVRSLGGDDEWLQ